MYTIGSLTVNYIVEEMYSLSVLLEFIIFSATAGSEFLLKKKIEIPTNKHLVNNLKILKDSQILRNCAFKYFAVLV